MLKFLIFSISSAAIGWIDRLVIDPDCTPEEITQLLVTKQKILNTLFKRGIIVA